MELIAPSGSRHPINVMADEGSNVTVIREGLLRQLGQPSSTVDLPAAHRDCRRPRSSLDAGTIGNAKGRAGRALWMEDRAWRARTGESHSQLQNGLSSPSSRPIRSEPAGKFLSLLRDRKLRYRGRDPTQVESRLPKGDRHRHNPAKAGLRSSSALAGRRTEDPEQPCPGRASIRESQEEVYKRSCLRIGLPPIHRDLREGTIRGRGGGSVRVGETGPILSTSPRSRQENLKETEVVFDVAAPFQGKGK